MKHLLYILAVGFLMNLMVFEVQAAEVVFKVVPNTTPQETVTIVEVRLDPQGKELNALEGIIGFSGAGVESIASVVIENGDSDLAFWPVPPAYSSEEKVIRFTGGTIGSLPKDSLLFRLRISSFTNNDLSLTWLGGSAYQNDGLGTAEGISSRTLTISLAKSQLTQINTFSPDSTPPMFDYVTVSQDTDVFEGKYFISFKASDDLSGVSHYEVVEGAVKTQNSDGIYLLQDQSRNSRVIVIAYDKAGNSNSIKVVTKYEWLFDYKFILGGLVLIILFIWLLISKLRVSRR